MQARTMRRTTKLLTLGVLGLVAREGQATRLAETTAYAQAGTEPCGPGWYLVCLAWEPCPDLGDLLTFCDAALASACPGQGLIAMDALCPPNDNDYGAVECFLATGDPARVYCWMVR